MTLRDRVWDRPPVALVLGAAYTAAADLAGIRWIRCRAGDRRRPGGPGVTDPPLGPTHIAIVGATPLFLTAALAFTYDPMIGEVTAQAKYAHNAVMVAIVLIVVEWRCSGGVTIPFKAWTPREVPRVALRRRHELAEASRSIAGANATRGAIWQIVDSLGRSHRRLDDPQRATGRPSWSSAWSRTLARIRGCPESVRFAGTRKGRPTVGRHVAGWGAQLSPAPADARATVDRSFSPPRGLPVQFKLLDFHEPVASGTVGADRQLPLELPEQLRALLAPRLHRGRRTAVRPDVRRSGAVPRVRPTCRGLTLRTRTSTRPTPCATASTTVVTRRSRSAPGKPSGSPFPKGRR